jgi:hypothetical protein
MRSTSDDDLRKAEARAEQVGVQLDLRRRKNNLPFVLAGWNRDVEEVKVIVDLLDDRLADSSSAVRSQLSSYSSASQSPLNEFILFQRDVRKHRWLMLLF